MIQELTDLSTTKSTNDGPLVLNFLDVVNTQSSAVPSAPVRPVYLKSLLDSPYYLLSAKQNSPTAYGTTKDGEKVDIFAMGNGLACFSIANTEHKALTMLSQLTILADRPVPPTGQNKRAFTQIAEHVKQSSIKKRKSTTGAKPYETNLPSSTDAKQPNLTSTTTARDTPARVTNANASIRKPILKPATKGRPISRYQQSGGDATERDEIREPSTSVSTKVRRFNDTSSELGAKATRPQKATSENIPKVKTAHKGNGRIDSGIKALNAAQVQTQQDSNKPEDDSDSGNGEVRSTVSGNAGLARTSGAIG